MKPMGRSAAIHTITVAFEIIDELNFYLIPVVLKIYLKCIYLFTGMTEILPGLMSSISMIHSISQFYNTSERMTSLFVKVKMS